MGAFKKSLFPLLMLAGLVALFQNCGSNMKGHGNGDPYENLGSDSGSGMISLFPDETMSQDEGILAPYLECNAVDSAQHLQTIYQARNNGGGHVLGVHMRPSITKRLILLPWTEGQTFASYNRQLPGNVTLISVDFSDSPVMAFVSVAGSTIIERFNCDPRL